MGRIAFIASSHHTVAGVDDRRLVMTASDTTTLTQLRTLKAWHAVHVESGGAVFPTYASLQWFIRINYQELVCSKVLIPGKGGRSSLVTPAFDGSVFRILTTQTN